jgi:ubiquinone/menaquinone biosynthesis C-methylase UbiE
MGNQPTTTFDPDKAAALAFKVWDYKQGELVSLMFHIGDRLGLYPTLAELGTTTADGLASETGLHARWLTEWLRSQAAAGILESADGNTFTMSPEAVAVMADDQNSLFYAAGTFQGPMPQTTLDGLLDAFSTGIGLTYEQLGPSMAHTTERTLGPWSRLALVPELIPRIDGLLDSLESGASVADVGCGTGTALLAMADAFGRSRFIGIDPSRHAIDRGRDHIREAGLENVELVCDGFEALPKEPTHDLILTFDCLHDMTRPREAAAAIRGAIQDDGIWLVKEIRAQPTWAENQRNPMLAMMYATSVATCMSSAMSEEGGEGLGTLGLHAELLEEIAMEAGFATMEAHDIGDPANLYYEIRP